MLNGIYTDCKTPPVAVIDVVPQGRTGLIGSENCCSVCGDFSQTSMHLTHGLAPVVLFVYNRLDHVQQTVAALRSNTLAPVSDLIIYADGARTAAASSAVAEVRAYLPTITGFNSVTIRPRGKNFGLAQSIIQGVTEVLQQHERIIVLEDDLVTSPHFLTYMNEALVRFADDARVVSIHGYSYAVTQPLPEAFFLPGADCWGWATWRRGWACFSSDGGALLDEIKRRKLSFSFDFNGAYPYTQMLKAQIKGANDSWAVRWYASAFLAGKLTLYPGRSLVHNIGNDQSGTHCGVSTRYDTMLSQTPIDLSQVAVEPSEVARHIFADFLRQTQGRLWQRWLRRVVQRLRAALR